MRPPSATTHEGMRADNRNRRLRGFRALASDQLWASLVQSGVREQHRAGERLLNQGEPGGWVLLGLAGRFKVVYSEPDGREVLLAVRGPGDVIGEFSGRDGRCRSASVQAVEPGITSKISDRRFNEVVEQADATEPLNAYIMGKLRESAPHAWQLAHRTTAVRLAGLFSELIDVAGPDHPSPNTIAMSQEELASALGVVRSAITPVLADWKDSGLIWIARGKVHIPDLDALENAVLSSTGQNDQ